MTPRPEGETNMQTSCTMHGCTGHCGICTPPASAPGGEVEIQRFAEKAFHWVGVTFYELRRDEDGEYVRYADHLAAVRRAAEQGRREERERFKGVVDRLMWQGDNHGPMASGEIICRGCYQGKTRGHAKDCWIVAALSDDEGRGT